MVNVGRLTKHRINQYYRTYRARCAKLSATFHGAVDRSGVLERLISLAVRERIARWSVLTLEFAVSAGIAQAAGMISGLIYVRLMPVDQYALYAMALTSLAVVSMGSDMGLMGSLGYSWRQSAGNAKVIGSKIAAVRRLRFVFLAIAVCIGGALLLKTVAEQSLSISSVMACFSMVVATVLVSLPASIDMSLMRMAGMQREVLLLRGCR